MPFGIVITLLLANNFMLFSRVGDTKVIFELASLTGKSLVKYRLSSLNGIIASQCQ